MSTSPAFQITPPIFRHSLCTFNKNRTGVWIIFLLFAVPIMMFYSSSDRHYPLCCFNELINSFEEITKKKRSIIIFSIKN
jgi:hypothetical protein